MWGFFVGNGLDRSVPRHSFPSRRSDLGSLCEGTGAKHLRERAFPKPQHLQKNL